MDPANARPASGPAAHAGLQDLFSYPLTEALQDRRTRRVAQGVSLPAGPMTYESANPPSPVTPLEEAILIAATGPTGPIMNDGPLFRLDGFPEMGMSMMHPVGRAGPSPDNAQATTMFMINDEGIWLLRRPWGRDALEIFRQIPRRWEDRTEDDWLTYANLVKVKVHEERMTFPRRWPYYLGWNAHHSNAPGTTCFLPVVDNTRQYINALLILLSEQPGAAPLFVDDWRKFHPKGPVERIAWAAAKLGFVDPIPYQPIGGIKRVKGGFVTTDVPVPMGALGSARTDYEAFLLLQNLLLTGEALRLGGWVHSAPLAPHIMQRDPENQALGLGFRQHTTKTPKGRWRRMPPVPASQPNYVGIDGVLEGLCPPYVTDMDAAVDQLLEEKMGPKGIYGDVEMFGLAYKDRDSAETYLRNAKPHPPEAIKYAKEICRYLYETYGRFPAHTDAFYLPGIWTQFSHLELEYYERFGNPNHARRQVEGKQLWGR